MSTQKAQSVHIESFPAPVKIQAWRAAIRALISGYVDGFTLVSFGVYASFMTGNTTSGGAYAGKLNFAAAGHSLLPIPFFLLGILIGTLLVQHDEHPALHRLSTLVSTMLLLDAGANYIGVPQCFSIIILSTAMGILNASITEVGGQPVSVGFMTGDLNSFARQIAMRIQGRLEPEPLVRPGVPGRVGILAGLWIAFFSGAVLGTVLMPLLTVGLDSAGTGIVRLCGVGKPAISDGCDSALIGGGQRHVNQMFCGKPGLKLIRPQHLTHQ